MANERILAIIKSLPGIKWLIGTYTFMSFRHWCIRRFGSRKGWCTLTLFLRCPSQFEALTGPVIDYLMEEKGSKVLKIAVLACSNGSEPYSVASVLKHRRPDVKFEIYAYDIDRNMLEKAKNSIYSLQEIKKNGLITDDFLNEIFDICGDDCTVKPEIADHVRFGYANLLDYNLRDIVGLSDIVYAQNVLVNLRPSDAKIAFHNICGLLKERSALFIDGMDIGLRTSLTRSKGLVPLEFKLEEIYVEARRILSGWPSVYSGLEPLSSDRKDWKRRYSTVFLR